jgi:MoaA/NifB/PqqE/SkfB family radical SAM enzyme
MCALTNDDGLYIHADLDEETLKNLQGSLSKINVISLNGHGESLMHPKFLEILSEMGKAGHRLELTSNGLLISDEVAKAIVLERLDELTISIHAVDPDMYSKISAKGDLETLVKNITTINRYKKMYNSLVPKLTFQCVSMKKNISQLEKLVSLASQLHVSKLVILKLQEYGLVHGESLDKHPELVRKYLPAAIKTAQELDIELIVHQDYLQMLKVKSLIETNEMNDSECIHANLEMQGKARNCLDPWITSFIAIDGEVYPCCNIRDSVGNLKESTFEAIWFGEGLSLVQKNILSGNPPAQCLTCSQRGITTLTRLKLKVALRRFLRLPLLKQIHSALVSHSLFRRFSK